MKKIFAKIHLWLSIPFGIIIAIVCLTGAILVFEDEIKELCYPSHYFVNEVREKPLPIAELIISARSQLPDSLKINGIRVTSDPERTYQLVLPGKKVAAFINPYSGEVVGTDDGQGFFMQTMRLHRWLLNTYKRDGSFSWGKAIVGYSTLVFVVILISGIITWIPRSKKTLKARLKVKTGAGWRRFFYDLHVSGGIYASLLLLVLALTGLTWSFDWYRNTFYNVFGVSSNTEKSVSVASGKKLEEMREPKVRGREGKNSTERGGKGSEGKTKHQDKVNYVSWDNALKALQKQYKEFKSITIQDGSATVSVNRYGNTRGSDRFIFDSNTGGILEAQLYKDIPKSGKIRGWIYSVHVGTWGGMTTRILSFLVSFLGAIFVFTGYYFWIKKISKKKKRSSR